LTSATDATDNPGMFDKTTDDSKLPVAPFAMRFETDLDEERVATAEGTNTKATSDDDTGTWNKGTEDADT
jgi:hypothetical protein